MNDPHSFELLAIAGDSDRGLPERKRSVRELGALGSPELIDPLRRVLRRPRPGPGLGAENWDPVAAERVVDLYLIEALYHSGDASELDGIAQRVAVAGDILEGPDDERKNAAAVILGIGRLEPIQQLVALAGAEQDHVVANAVRTLQLLGLPRPPSGGDAAAYPFLHQRVTFSIDNLRDELRSIAALSSGTISLSDGVEERIASRNEQRGTVRREDESLLDILTLELDMLRLTYCTEPGGVVICTFREAGHRWQQKWPAYARHLIYDRERRRFVEREPARAPGETSAAH